MVSKGRTVKELEWDITDYVWCKDANRGVPAVSNAEPPPWPPPDSLWVSCTISTFRFLNDHLSETTRTTTRTMLHRALHAPRPTPPDSRLPTSPTASRLGQPQASSIRIAAPLFIDFKDSVAPTTRPTRLTGLAARGRWSTLAGVGPKKMQNAWPLGQ